MDSARSFVHAHKKLLIVGAIFLFITLLLLLFLSQKSSSTPNSAGDASKRSVTPTLSSSSNPLPARGKLTIHYVKISQPTIDEAATESALPQYTLFTASPDGTTSVERAKITGPIKQLEPIDMDKYLYIGDLGFLDRGNTIYLLDTKTKVTKKFIDADSGFQFESYLLSPDKTSLVYWEESIGTTNAGMSQIVLVSLNDPSKKKILVTESLSDQTKYPLLWSKATGKIYLDSYSVERNGKARGMFELSTSGTITPLTGLSLDQYSANPILSPNGDILAFTSYNQETSVRIPAPNVPNGLLRESVRNPNQIKTYNLITGYIETIKENTAGTLFDSLVWDKDGRNIIYRTLTISGEKETIPQEFRIFTLASKKDAPFASNTNGIFLKQFPNSDMLMGTRSEIVDSIGSFTTGSFGQVFASVYLYSPFGQTYSKILSDDLIQIIAIE